MEKHNFAAYKAGTFSIDTTNLELNGNTFVDKDYPAFVHEYCHYIQDFTQISSIMGFSMWMIDIAKLTEIFSSGEGQTIKIPLEEKADPHRRFYNLFAGNSDDVFDLDYSSISLKEISLEIIDVPLNGENRKLAVNHIHLNNSSQQKVHFGLIALQEIQAFYAQKLAEKKVTDVTLSVYADELPSFPYKFGDFLFRENNIEMDCESKFILCDLCLDTIQAPTVFLDVLNELKGQKFPNFNENIKRFEEIVDRIRKKSSHSNDEALKNILPDLKKWSTDNGRKYLTQAIDWYLNLIGLAQGLKEIGGKTFFSMAFTMNSYNFGLLFKTFTPPVYLRNNIFYRNTDDQNPENDSDFIKDFEAATTLWSHKILYDFLVSTNKEEMNARCSCPLFENCLEKVKIDDEYTCKTAPWEIIKNEKKIICQYGMAAHSFGLWQNSLDINRD